MHQQYGGSIFIEILILLFCWGILIPLSQISFTKIKRARSLHQTTDSIEALLQGAHTTSLYQGNILSLVQDQAQDISIRNQYEKIYTYTINKKFISNILISSSASNRESIQFYPDGYTTPGRIEIHTKDKLCILSVSLRGRVRKSCPEKR